GLPIAVTRAPIESPAAWTWHDPQRRPPETRRRRALPSRPRRDGRESICAWAATMPPRYRGVARTLPTNAPHSGAYPGPPAPHQRLLSSRPCGWDLRCPDTTRCLRPPTRAPRHDAPARPDARPGTTRECSPPPDRGC